MAKQRFRDTKKGKVTETNSEPKDKKPAIPFAGNGIKAKAFLTDTFMIFMPIFYFVIYVVYGSLQEASLHRMEAWAYTLLPYIVIQTIFMLKDNGRTPGARANNLRVIDIHTLDTPPLFSIIFRNFAFLLSLLSFFGWIMVFFRKDHRGLHDLLSNTCVVPHETDNSKKKETKVDPK